LFCFYLFLIGVIVILTMVTLKILLSLTIKQILITLPGQISSGKNSSIRARFFAILETKKKMREKKVH